MDGGKRDQSTLSCHENTERFFVDDLVRGGEVEGALSDYSTNVLCTTR